MEPEEEKAATLPPRNFGRMKARITAMLWKGAIHIIAPTSRWPIRYPAGMYVMYSLRRLVVKAKKQSRINHRSWSRLE